MVDVGALSDFEEGRARAITVGGREIAVVRWRNAFYAIRNRCPHMHALLSGGFVAPMLCQGGEIGTLVADDDAPVLSCPWHLWQFDLKSGSALGDRKYRISTFRTESRDDRLYVEVNGSASPAVAAQS